MSLSSWTRQGGEGEQDHHLHRRYAAAGGTGRQPHGPADLGGLAHQGRDQHLRR